MSFKNLEQRFNETVNDLYRGAKLKFDGGRASTGANDDPLMVRRPGDGRIGIKQEGRGAPLVSAPRDTVRMTLFSASLRGIAFYAKQQLLQTGNTFAITRGLNPAFVIGNTIPFLHIRRSLRPTEGILGITPPQSVEQLRTVGQLQKETYEKLAGNPSYPGISGFLREVPILGRLTSFAAANRSVGDGDYDWNVSRPELAEGKYHVYNMMIGASNQSTKSNLFATIGNRILPGFISRRLNNLFLSPENTPNIIDLTAVKNRYGVSAGNEYITYFESGLGPYIDKGDYRKFNVSAYFRPKYLTGDDIRSDLIINQTISDFYKIEPFLETDPLQNIILENTLELSYIDNNRIIDEVPTGPAQDYRLFSILPNNNIGEFYRASGISFFFRSDLFRDQAKDRLKDFPITINLENPFIEYLEKVSSIMTLVPTGPAKDYTLTPLSPNNNRGTFYRVPNISDIFRTELFAMGDKERLRDRTISVNEENPFINYVEEVSAILLSGPSGLARDYISEPLLPNSSVDELFRTSGISPLFRSSLFIETNGPKLGNRTSAINDSNPFREYLDQVAGILDNIPTGPSKDYNSLSLLPTNTRENSFRLTSDLVGNGGVFEFRTALIADDGRVTLKNKPIKIKEVTEPTREYLDQVASILGVIPSGAARDYTTLALLPTSASDTLFRTIDAVDNFRSNLLNIDEDGSSLKDRTSLIKETSPIKEYLEESAYNLKPSPSSVANDYSSPVLLPTKDRESLFRYPAENIGDGGSGEFRSANISEEIESKLKNKETRVGDPEEYLENSATLLSQQPTAPAKDYTSELLEPTSDRDLFRVSQEQIPDGFRSDLVSGESLKNKDREKIDRRLTTSKEEFQRIADEFIQEKTGGLINEQPFLKYFVPENPNVIISRGGGTNARDLSNAAGRNLKYVRDPLNYETEGGNTLPRYNTLPTAGENGNQHTTDDNGNKIDPILVSFAMGNDHHVQFRAFIRDINQRASPEYKTYQYIGRIEKFISYVTVQREVSFKLDVLAMSKDELDVVWKRINFLTSLVFPYGVTKGILQPNIVRMTIGKIFVDQPAYITSLGTTFNEISESWDIDREVPIAATFDLSMSIIEKSTMTANKPFFGIVEEQQVPEVIAGENQPLPRQITQADISRVGTI